MPRTAAPPASSSSGSSSSSSASSSASSSSESDSEHAPAPAPAAASPGSHSGAAEDEADAAAEAHAAAAKERRAQQADRKLGTKLHHVFRLVAAAVRRARTHELQRQIKRLRPLAAGSAEARAAEAELAALKALLPEPLAARALRSKLVKAKLLPRGAAPEAAEAQEFPLLRHVSAHEALAAAAAGSSAGAAASADAAGKVEARVLSNKGLADEVQQAVDALRALVRPDEVHTSAKKAGDAVSEQRVDSAAASVQRADKGKGREQAPRSRRAQTFVPLGEAKLLEREWSGEEDEQDDDGDDDGLEGDSGVSEDEESQDDESDLDEAEAARRVAALGDLSRFDAMLGGSSDEEDAGADSAASSDAEGSAQPAARQAASAAPAERKRKRSASPAAGKGPKKGKQKAAAEAEPPVVGSSTFLPSLSSGFVSGRGLRLGKDGDEWSGSEGELSEIDEDAEDRGKEGKKIERKNRRGQRERRAIWEKKYGRAANHVKLREKEARAATRVYDPTTAAPTRDASGARQRPAPFQAPGRVDGGWRGGVANAKAAPPRPTVPPARPPRPQHHAAPRPPPRSAMPPAAKQEQKQEQMHPSWIAKQKQKELAAQAAKGAIKAKKIVFD